MNNGRVRKSLNTLIRAYKKKNRERNIILQCIVVSVVVVSLVIISLIHGKFQADKLKINIKMEKQFQHLLKKEQIQ